MKLLKKVKAWFLRGGKSYEEIVTEHLFESVKIIPNCGCNAVEVVDTNKVAFYFEEGNVKVTVESKPVVERLDK